MGIARALRAELRKLRRSKALVGTLGAAVGAVVPTLLLVLLADPDLVSPLWESVLTTGTRNMAGFWGALIFGLTAAHLFGGEFIEGTASSLLTLPVRRESIVAAKLLTLGLWMTGLVLASVTAHVALAAGLGAEGPLGEVLGRTLRDGFEIALMMFLMMPVVALLSVLGRGYLAPMLYSMVVTVVGMSFAFLNWTSWCPWAMPMAVAGAPGPVGINELGVPWWSWLVLGALFIAGTSALFAQMQRAGEAG